MDNCSLSNGRPFFFPLFGVVFIIMGIVQAVYHFKNATSKNRYSAFDITDAHEETDPLNERFGRQSVANSNENRAVDGNVVSALTAAYLPRMTTRSVENAEKDLRKRVAIIDNTLPA